MEILFFRIKQNILKRDMTDVHEEELGEEQDPRVRTTSSGRILKASKLCLFKTRPN